MAMSKYAGDYRLEYEVTEAGKTRCHRVYQGTWYAFIQPPGALGYQTIAAVGSIFLLLLPLLWRDSTLSRQWTVLLPTALAVLPLYLLFAAAQRLLRSQSPFTREYRDKTQKRFQWAGISLTLLLTAACIGCWVQGLRTDPLGAGGLHLSLLVAVYLLTQNKKLRTEPVKTQDTFQEENHEKT